MGIEVAQEPTRCLNWGARPSASACPAYNSRRTSDVRSCLREHTEGDRSNRSGTARYVPEMDKLVDGRATFPVRLGRADAEVPEEVESDSRRTPEKTARDAGG